MLEDRLSILKEVIVVVGATWVERPRESSFPHLAGPAQENELLAEIFF